MARTKWEPHEGNFRAAGEGPLGVHYGPPVWALDGAVRRRERDGSYLPRTWVETYRDGAWKRVGDVVTNDEPPPPSP